PLGMRGLELVEFAAHDPEPVRAVFRGLGFSRTRCHRSMSVDSWRQHDVHFVLSSQPGTFAWEFAAAHGPSVSALALRFDDPSFAFAEAVRRGARPFLHPAGERATFDAPAIYGVGDSLLYFLHAKHGAAPFDRELVPLHQPDVVPERGFRVIDHLTNNVARGELERWATFYRDIFGFTDVRYFDIRGEKTGLHSFALRSPCGTFCIPINEGSDVGSGKRSQIDEYLDEYNGPGIQHLAFLTADLLGSLRALEHTPIAFLDIDDDYYREVFDRVPGVREDRAELVRRQVLVDGDEQGYLLQIFTKNLLGPIFIELIQRHNHLSFGEGNFGALFRSIERDQQRRGYFT
ncbi:MAG TPA: 4-hydroxyphenylpyruvate dioxygenase, partial [Kofleriaceae bacterium]